MGSAYFVVHVAGEVIRTLEETLLAEVASTCVEPAERPEDNGAGFQTRGRRL